MPTSRGTIPSPRRVLEAVEETFRLLAKNPGSGIVYRTRNRRLQDVRMFPVAGFPNYLVFYRIDAEAVRMLHVVHGARHLPRLFRRARRE